MTDPRQRAGKDKTKQTSVLQDDKQLALDSNPERNPEKNHGLIKKFVGKDFFGSCSLESPIFIQVGNIGPIDGT